MKQQKTRLSHIVDFYYLVALQHATNSMNQFHRPTERLARDVADELEELSNKLGTAIRDYLYIASCGEARHARSCTRGNYIPTIEPGGTRASVCRDSANYPPTIDNMRKIESLFRDFDWRGSYGGLRWRDIIESAILFDTLDLCAFIDHIVDVYHNGGRLFDKSSAAEVAMLNCDITRHTIQSFLDYKRDADILHDVIMDSEPKRITRMLSARTSRLLARYYRIAHNADLPNWLRGEGDASYCFAVNLQYADKQHADIVTTRDGSSDYIPRRRLVNRVCWQCGYEAYSGEGVWYTADSGNLYCEDCYHDKFTGCAQCSEEVRVDNAYTQDYDTVCKYCAVECPSCFEVVEFTGNMVRLNGEMICEDCYSDALEDCEYCGDSFEESELQESDSGLAICEACIYRRRAGYKTINPTIDYNESNYTAGLFTAEPRRRETIEPRRDIPFILLKGDSYCETCKITGCLYAQCAKYNAAQTVYLSLINKIEEARCYCYGCQHAITHNAIKRTATRGKFCSNKRYTKQTYEAITNNIESVVASIVKESE